MTARTLMMALLWIGFSVTCHAQVQHIYDENGRLAGTIDPTGNAARFTYDAAGNITAIARFTPTQVSIIEFTPNTGPGSSSVTIWGTGFSATPAQNTVTFNGLAGTVTAATVNKLTVTAPAGATTGAIVVTSPNGNATSATSFTVAANPAAPTISSFSPGIVAANAAITVNGTGFLTPAAGNKLRLNASYSQITSATSTQLQTTLAPYNLGGRISVATQWGSATSASDLFVVPTGYAVADVVDTGRLTPGGASRTINFAAAGKVSLTLFDAVQGQRMLVSIDTPATASGTLRVYSPDGEWMFDSPSLNRYSKISLPVTRTGSYTILISSIGAGSVTISVQAMTNTIVLDGAATNYSWSGSSLYTTGFVFDAPIHANVGLGMSASSLPGTVFLDVTGPTGMSMILGNTSGTNGISFDLEDLPMTGRYMVELGTGGNPASVPSGNVSFWLSSDLTGTLTPGGSVTYPVTARPGQNGRYTFSGTAGDYMSLVIDIPGSFPQGLNVRAVQPNGQGQGSTTSPTSGTTILDLGQLPATGTYTVIVSPAGAVAPTSAATVTLQKAVTGTITPGAAATNFSLAAGQNARYTFTVAGASGQNIGAAINVTTMSAGQIQYRLRDASNTVVTEVTAVIPGTSLNASNLTIGQTYTLEIDPNAAVPTAGSILLSNDFTGTLALGGANTSFASSRAGQNGRYTFAIPTPPVNLGLGVSTVSGISGSENVSFSLIQPDTSTLNLGTLNGPGSEGQSFDLSGLTQSGTYTVFVNPNALAVPTFAMTLSSDATGSFSVGATGFTFNTTRPGQNARYTLSGTANQRLTLRATTPSGSFVYGGVIRVFRANGTQVGSDYPLPINADVAYNLPLLPATETYTVFVSPTQAGTGQTTIRMIQAASGSVAVGGAVVNFTPSPAGQYARYTITPSLTVGQNLGIGLKVTGASAGTTQINVLDPSGNPISGGSTTISNGLNTVGELDVTAQTAGSYLIDLLPSVAGTPTLALTVSNDVAGTITPGGAQVTFSSSRVGENGRYTFAVGALRQLTMTVNSGGTLGTVNYFLFRPGGSFFTFGAFGNGGGTWTPPNLDTTGTWTLFVSPTGTSIPGSATFGITLQ